MSDLEAALSTATAQKGIKLYLDLDPQLPQNLVVPSSTLFPLLKTILEASLGSTSRGHVRLSVRQGGTDGDSSLRFDIVDTGMGVDAKALRDKCQQLADDLQMRLEISSEKDQGSRIELIGRVASEDARAGQGQAPYILVAEDNIVNQMVVIKMLQKHGYKVHAVQNGQEVLDTLGTTPYDLILMDCQMPGMDGLEATKFIRMDKDHLGSKTDIPIIALTAHTLVEQKESCLSSGMNDFLPKPVNFVGLGEMVEKWLPQEKRRTLDSMAQ